MRAWTLALAVLAFAGCRHHKQKSAEVRWFFDRGHIGETFASIPDADRFLVLGTDGLRWTENADHGLLEIATDLREPLVAARKRNGRFELAGESGTLYTSPTILGKLSKWNAGLPHPKSIALGADAIVGVDASGTLVRSIDDGKTFAKIDLPRQGTFASVAMVGRTGIALGVPAFGLYTKDDGATWKAFDLPRNTSSVGVQDGLSLRIGVTWRRFDIEKLSFSPEYTMPSRKREDVALRVIDGARGLRLLASEDNLGAHDVRIEVAGGKNPISKSLWDDCLRIDAAMHGNTIVVTCDEIDDSKLVRSDDGGVTFREIPTGVSGTQPVGRASLAIGDGFLWYGPRCGKKCTSPQVLDRAGAWHEVTDTSEALAFANDGKDLYELTSGLSVRKWVDGKPTELAKLPPQKDVTTSRIGADRGIVRVSVESNDTWLAWEIDGTAVHELTLPKVHTPAFAGKFGLAKSERGELLEMTDGKTFHRVAGPRIRTIYGCSTEGCATDRGFRFGWSKREDEIKPPERAFARPFDCKAAGEWTEVGSSQMLPNADSVDRGASRWVAGLRGEDGSIVALRVGWNGQTDRTPLLGAAPHAADDRSLTTVQTQANGMVAQRLAYKRGEGGVRNPVSVSAAWLRDDGGRFEIKPRVVGTFFTQHDPQTPGLAPTDDWVQPGPFTSWLGPRGFWFHGPFTGLWHFQDDGVATTYFGDAFNSVGGRNVVLERGTPRLFSIGSSDMEIAPPQSNDPIPTRPLLEETGELAIFDGRPIALFRGKAVAFDLADDGTVTNASELASVDARTPACAPGPGTGAITIPFVSGARHPVMVGSNVYVTDRLRVRIANGSACIVAWEAVSTKLAGRYGALIFANDPKQSIEFQRDVSTWPSKLSMRPLSCEPADLPFPEELSTLPGFTN